MIENNTPGSLQAYCIPNVHAPLTLWNRPAFLATVSALNYAQERQMRLRLYRESVDEHLRAADDALITMREIETSLGEERIVRVIDGDRNTYEIGWHDPDAVRVAFLRYGKELRAVVNEARAALESLAFEIATALDASVQDSDRTVGFTSKMSGYTKKHPATRPLADFIANLHNPKYEEFDQIRQISYHRRVVPTLDDIRFHTVGGELISTPCSCNPLPGRCLRPLPFVQK